MNRKEWQASYDAQRPWSDRLTPELIDVLRRALNDTNISDIRISTEVEDIRDGCDVVVTDDEGKQFFVGLRVRTFKQLQRYGNQFTIRDKQNRYGQTELEKVKAGKLHAMLYAFADEEGQKIAVWRLLRMKAVKLAVEEDPRFALVGVRHEVHDHCRFYAFDVTDFPVGSLVIAQKTQQAA